METRILALAPPETRLPKTKQHFPYMTPLVGGSLSDELKDFVYGLGGNPRLGKRALGGREMVGIEGSMSDVWEGGSSGWLGDGYDGDNVGWGGRDRCLSCSCLMVFLVLPVHIMFYSKRRRWKESGAEQGTDEGGTQAQGRSGDSRGRG